jgi:hypothetical protein
MLSESARMSTAAEARFRVQAANSKPRAITVVALDGPSESVVGRLAKASWSQATFFTASSFGGGNDVMNEVDTADLVVMVATPGADMHAASIIGEACRRKRVMTTTLVVGAASVSDEALSKTLSAVRPWSEMVVIANADEYVDDLLTALRA